MVQVAQAAQADVDSHREKFVDVYVNEICPEIIPVSVAYDYDAVSGILELMTDKRADTIGEAINLYEEIRFRRDLLQKLDENRAIVERIEKLSKTTSVAVQSTRAAVAAVEAYNCSRTYEPED